MEGFRKACRINATFGFSDAMPCLCLIIATGYGQINRTCHFSPLRMLRSWANALYSENNAFRQALVSRTRPPLARFAR